MNRLGQHRTFIRFYKDWSHINENCKFVEFFDFKAHRKHNGPAARISTTIQVFILKLRLESKIHLTSNHFYKAVSRLPVVQSPLIQDRPPL